MLTIVMESSTVNGTRAYKVVLDGDVVGNETYTCGGRLEGLIPSIMMRNDYLFLMPG
jgi:hypothetical protein